MAADLALPDTVDEKLVDCGPASHWRAPAVPSGPPPAISTYLRLADGVRLAVVSGEVVALDLRTDRYFAFGPAASAELQEIVAAGAMLPAPGKYPPSLAAAVRSGLLVSAEQPPAPLALPGARTAGGVRSRSRLAYTDGATRGRVEPGALVRARRLIRHFDRMLGTHGLATLLDVLQEHADAARRELPETPARRRLMSLATAHENAWLLVGRTRRSVTAAAALAVHAWRHSVPARVVLGVQKYPFYAHMWVEGGGALAGAADDVVDRLAPLLVVAAGKSWQRSS
jgi:hypothetical protein